MTQSCFLGEAKGHFKLQSNFRQTQTSIEGIILDFFAVVAIWSLSCVQLFWNPRLLCPWDFPGNNNWSGLPFPSPGDLPDPGIEPVSLVSSTLAGRFFTTWAIREARIFDSVKFSPSVVSSSLWPHELQHTRPPCPSPAPGVHSNSCPSSRWCHPAISSSVVPFSSCPQSLPASESFPMSQLFAWGGQSTGVSALASFFPKNT